MRSVETSKGYQIQGHLPGYEITLVNPGARSWTRHKYVFSFGAYSDTKLMVWANGPDSGFDEAVDWLFEHAPGLLADEQVEEAYQEALADGVSEEEAYEHSLEDVSTGGNCGHHVLSYEWTFVEDPSREQLKDMLRI